MGRRKSAIEASKKQGISKTKEKHDNLRKGGSNNQEDDKTDDIAQLQGQK